MRHKLLLEEAFKTEPNKLDPSVLTSGYGFSIGSPHSTVPLPVTLGQKIQSWPENTLLVSGYTPPGTM